jgi:hypothetical protein
VYAVYDIVREPRGESYSTLIDFCAGLSRSATVVIREPDWLDDEGRRVLSELRRFQLGETQASAWPGTRLTNGTATVYSIPIIETVIEIVKESAAGLYDWQQPSRPEDLCFIRENGEPVLATIAHEEDAFLLLSEEEFFKLSSLLPALEVKSRPPQIVRLENASTSANAERERRGE